MAGIYADGFDENGQWEASTANAALAKSGHIVALGQIPDWMKKQLDAHAKAGRLVKYRGHFNTGQRTFGMGPLKTIWALPEIAEEAAIIDAGIEARCQRRVA